MNSKASDVEAAGGGGGEEQIQHTHIVNQCSLDPLKYVSWIVQDYPKQLSAAPLLYNELLKSDGASICLKRWKKVIKHEQWMKLEKKTPHLKKVCTTFYMVSHIMAAQMISCTLGLSSLKKWLQSKECDEYKYNFETHKEAAIYFSKAIERILHGTIFDSSTNLLLTKACTSQIPKESRVASTRQDTEVTGYSYDDLMDMENRLNPLIVTIAKALTGREVEDNHRNKFVNSFIDSKIGQKLVAPWINILEQHQKHLWEIFKDLACHSTFIMEYHSAGGLGLIDGKTLEEHSKWGHFTPVALFNATEWMCVLKGEPISRDTKEIERLINSEKTSSSQKKRKASSEDVSKKKIKKKKASEDVPKKKKKIKKKKESVRTNSLEDSPTPTKKKRSSADMADDVSSTTAQSNKKRKVVASRTPKKIIVPTRVSLSPPIAPRTEKEPPSLFSPQLSEKDKKLADEIRKGEVPLPQGLANRQLRHALPRFPLNVDGTLDKSSGPITTSPTNKHASITISKKAVTSIADGQYVNDEWLSALAKQFNNKQWELAQNDPSHKTLHIFNTSFVVNLCFRININNIGQPDETNEVTPIYEPERVDLWGGKSTKPEEGVDIFSAFLLYFHINEVNSHYYDIIIDPNSLKQWIADSMHQDLDPDPRKPDTRKYRLHVLKCLYNWIKHQHKLRIGSPHPVSAEWDEINVRGHDYLGNIMQTSVDCALYTHLNPSLQANKKEMNSLSELTVEDRDAIGIDMRRRFTLSIANGSDMFGSPSDTDTDEISNLGSHDDDLGSSTSDCNEEAAVESFGSSVSSTNVDNNEVSAALLTSRSDADDDPASTNDDHNEEEGKVNDAIKVITRTIKDVLPAEEHERVMHLLERVRKLHKSKLQRGSDSSDTTHAELNSSIITSDQSSLKRNNEETLTETVTDGNDTYSSIDGSSSKEVERDQERQRSSIDLEDIRTIDRNFKSIRECLMATNFDLLHIVTEGLATMICQNNFNGISVLVKDFVQVLLPLIRANYDYHMPEVKALEKKVADQKEMCDEFEKVEQAQIGKLLSLLDKSDSNDCGSYQPELRAAIGKALGKGKEDCSNKTLEDFLRLKVPTKRVLLHCLNFLMVKNVVDVMKLSDLHRDSINGAIQEGIEEDSIMQRVGTLATKVNSRINLGDNPTISSILADVIMPAMISDNDSDSKSATDLLIDISEVMIGRPSNDEHFDEKIKCHFVKAESSTMVGQTSLDPNCERIAKDRNKRRPVVRTWLILMLQSPLTKKFQLKNCVECTRAILLSFNSTEMYSKFTSIDKKYFERDTMRDTISVNELFQDKWTTNTDKRSLLIEDDTVNGLMQLYEHAYNTKKNTKEVEKKIVSEK